jgi:hypothetical protein
MTSKIEYFLKYSLVLNEIPKLFYTLQTNYYGNNLGDNAYFHSEQAIENSFEHHFEKLEISLSI